MRQSPIRLGGIAAALAIALCPPIATATVMRHLSLEEHLALSELVVRAKVIDAKSFVGEGGLPFTDTELEVLEVLAGDASTPKTLRVRQLKGMAGETYRAVPGDAELLVGEEVVLFLHGVEEGVAYLTALGQSKYLVDRPVGPPSPAGGGPLVIRDLPRGALYAPQGRPAPSAVEPPVELDVFLDTVRNLARSAR